MKTQSRFSRLVAGAAVTLGLLAPATGALAADKTERALIGALIGGVAGAALSNGEGGATALGAVAGAAVGVASARDDRDRYYRSRYSQAYAPDNRYRYASRYDGYRYGDRPDVYRRGAQERGGWRAPPAYWGR